MKKWLIVFLFLICSAAFGCDWVSFGSFIKEVKHIEYDEKCIHINQTQDRGKNNYSMMFYTRGKPTGTIYYEYTEKNLDFVVSFLNVYAEKKLTFAQILDQEFKTSNSTNDSSLTHQKMTIEFRDTNGNYSVFIKD